MKIDNYSINGNWHNKETGLVTASIWERTAVLLGLGKSGVKSVCWTAGGQLHAVHITSRSVHHMWGSKYGVGRIPNRERFPISHLAPFVS
jgi:hypothetical protein